MVMSLVLMDINYLMPKNTIAPDGWTTIVCMYNMHVIGWICWCRASIGKKSWGVIASHIDTGDCAESITTYFVINESIASRSSLSQSQVGHHSSLVTAVSHIRWTIILCIEAMNPVAKSVCKSSMCMWVYDSGKWTMA